MTKEQIISKMKKDMKIMRRFFNWTEESYLGKTKDTIKYNQSKSLLIELLFFVTLRSN